MTTTAIALEPLYTVEQVSDYLGIPVKTLYNWRSDGKGPRAVRIGRTLKYRESALRQFVDSLEAMQAAND